MALRRLAGNRDLIAGNILRSLSVAGQPPSSRPFLRPDNHPHSPPPPHSLPRTPSNVFDPLAASSTRSVTQGQLMNQHMEKFNPFLSTSGIMGIRTMGRVRDVRDALLLNMYKIDGIKADMKRSFSTSAESAADLSQTDVKVQPNANITRPLSPHLPVYKPQTNSVASIFNRISGAYLTAIVIAFYLLTMKLGPICFTFYPFYQFFFYSSKLALISAELAALATVYHLFHSFPHLFADISAILRRGRK
ncbi:hypothetical protein vseg_008114 [Gypsophila vaccaria]